MRIVVLRPEPGNAATRARIAEAGMAAVAMPLFAVTPLAWEAPDPARFDSLLLTSANAVRHARAALPTLAALPTVVVGEATAEAARAAGLNVVAVGGSDADAARRELDRLGLARALHLCGRDHLLDPGGPIAAVIPVYASIETTDRIDLSPGDLVLVHSPRAARRLAALVADRAAIGVVAISPRAAHAAGSGWRQVSIAATPDDPALIAAALAAH
ncbi:uroporphyrinogen-III synthase [Sphingomonas qomolangmaensis]|uniref:Uroporphyrinogen-III synthase n=1 Tax=Sphingomonas qomolangmaensis TaxID=2918765 RepID=A0ABY5LBE2_9SPHN|nr:uroporphyrinogen-III synthase [Sphingomonas qomolangmaensis]UUL81991.1 uroporphyrinogen-III synthase [Sphingomonas qomolangmaensis]